MQQEIHICWYICIQIRYRIQNELTVERTGSENTSMYLSSCSLHNLAQCSDAAHLIFSVLAIAHRFFTLFWLRSSETLDLFFVADQSSASMLNFARLSFLPLFFSAQSRFAMVGFRFFVRRSKFWFLAMNTKCKSINQQIKKSIIIFF